MVSQLHSRDEAIHGPKKRDSSPITTAAEAVSIRTRSVSFDIALFFAPIGGDGK